MMKQPHPELPGTNRATAAGLQLDLFDPQNPLPPQPRQTLLSALDSDRRQDVRTALDEMIETRALGLAHQPNLLILRSAWDDPIDSAHIEHAAAPAARAVLGVQHRAIIDPLYRRLLEKSHGRAFDPAHPQDHASFIAVRLGEWEQALTCATTDPGFSNIPELVCTAARASDALGRRDQAIGLWCELCWHHPGYAENHADVMPECFRNALAQAEDALVANAMRATPAWALMLCPGLAQSLPQVPQQADAWVRVCSPLARLVSEPRNMAHRRAVHGACPDALAAFLALRGF